MKRVVLKVNGRDVMPVMSANTILIKPEGKEEQMLNGIIDELLAEIKSLKEEVAELKKNNTEE